MIANALEWRMEELYWVWEQAVGRFTFVVVLLPSPDGFSLFGVVVCLCVFVWLVLCGCVFCSFLLLVLCCCVVDPPTVRRSPFIAPRNPILCLISSNFAGQSLVSTLLVLCCGYGVASYAGLRHFSHGLPVSYDPFLSFVTIFFEFWLMVDHVFKKQFRHFGFRFCLLDIISKPFGFKGFTNSVTRHH